MGCFWKSLNFLGIFCLSIDFLILNMDLHHFVITIYNNRICKGHLGNNVFYKVILLFRGDLSVRVILVELLRIMVV